MSASVCVCVEWTVPPLHQLHPTAGCPSSPVPQTEYSSPVWSWPGVSATSIQKKTNLMYGGCSQQFTKSCVMNIRLGARKVREVRCHCVSDGTLCLWWYSRLSLCQWGSWFLPQGQWLALLLSPSWTVTHKSTGLLTAHCLPFTLFL